MDVSKRSINGHNANPSNRKKMKQSQMELNGAKIKPPDKSNGMPFAIHNDNLQDKTDVDGDINCDVDYIQVKVNSNGMPFAIHNDNLQDKTDVDGDIDGDVNFIQDKVHLYVPHKCLFDRHTCNGFD